MKLVDQFIYVCSNISSTESTVNMGKAWTLIDWLRTWKSEKINENSYKL